MTRRKTSNFPLVPFDGQEFIDAFRIKWVYNAETRCWRRLGTVPDIPLASEVQDGLLSRQLKQLLDSIPEKGGHFGILAKPLLSVMPLDFPSKLKDKTYNAVKNEAGSVVYGLKPRKNEPYTPSELSGLFLRFTKGPLKDHTFLIYDNDEESIILQGDASEANYENEFIVFDPLEANEHGAIMGDVEIVSDTIDITCVDNMGNPITVTEDCRLEYKDSDEGPQRPGLDFKINDELLDSFCIELRACKGPKGDKGAKGETGADGTGDGPVGEMGDPGEDAPDVGHAFSGIKFVESEDTYDTAIIGLELDSDAGKLHVLKAKMKVPDNDQPATQVVASPVDRSLEWTDDEFGYRLLKPLNDPIESKDDSADVELAAYPEGYEVQTSGQVADIQKNRVTQFNSVGLSTLVDEAITYFRGRLAEIDSEYNLTVKEFIEEKDAKARTILAGLAQDLSECEWQLPIEFCLGITPDDCREDGGEDPGGDGGGGGGGGGSGGGGNPTPWPHPGDVPKLPPPINTVTPGGNNTNPVTIPSSGETPGFGFTPTQIPTPAYTPSPTPTPQPPPSGALTYVYTAALQWEGSILLPENAAWAFTYHSGALRTLTSSYFVGRNSLSEEGMVLIPFVDGQQTSPRTFPAIQSYDPNDLNSIEAAYKKGYYQGQLQGQEDRIVIGGNSNVTSIFVAVMARSDLIPDQKLFINVHPLFSLGDPIPGVKTQVVAMTNTGGAPGPTPPVSTDPVVTAAVPAIVPEGFDTTVTITGSNFVDGCTAQIIGNNTVKGPGAVGDPVVTFVSDTELEVAFHIVPDPLYPPPNNFDVLVVNPDGGNGIGIALFASAL